MNTAPSQADFLPRELFTPVPAPRPPQPEPPPPTLAYMLARPRRVDIELPIGEPRRPR